jgi:excisionase family DNA binding protein
MGTTKAKADPLFTKPEAAVELNVPIRFIERLVSERRIRFVRLGRHIRIPQSAIIEVIERGTVCERPQRRRWS